jgi:hypothetical protein
MTHAHASGQTQYVDPQDFQRAVRRRSLIGTGQSGYGPWGTPAQQAASPMLNRGLWRDANVGTAFAGYERGARGQQILDANRRGSGSLPQFGSQSGFQYAGPSGAKFRFPTPRSGSVEGVGSFKEGFDPSTIISADYQYQAARELNEARQQLQFGTEQGLSERSIREAETRVREAEMRLEAAQGQTGATELGHRLGLEGRMGVAGLQQETALSQMQADYRLRQLSEQAAMERVQAPLDWQKERFGQGMSMFGRMMGGGGMGGGGMRGGGGGGGFGGGFGPPAGGGGPAPMPTFEGEYRAMTQGVNQDVGSALANQEMAGLQAVESATGAGMGGGTAGAAMPGIQAQTLGALNRNFASRRQQHYENLMKKMGMQYQFAGQMLPAMMG